jgi:hypothetical protein
LNIDAMTRPARVYEVGRRNIFSAVVCVFLIAVETPSFATDTDRAAAAVQRREGVTIGGGDGSSFDKAMIVHADNLPKEFLAGYEYIVLRYRWFQLALDRLSITTGNLITLLLLRTLGRWVSRNRSAFSTLM